MAVSVSSPAGKEDIRAKNQRQRRKWIPAFAGMTSKSEGQSQAKRGFFNNPLKGGVAFRGESGKRGVNSG